MSRVIAKAADEAQGRKNQVRRRFFGGSLMEQEKALTIANRRLPVTAGVTRIQKTHKVHKDR